MYLASLVVGLTVSCGAACRRFRKGLFSCCPARFNLYDLSQGKNTCCHEVLFMFSENAVPECQFLIGEAWITVQVLQQFQQFVHHSPILSHQAVYSASVMISYPPYWGMKSIL